MSGRRSGRGKRKLQTRAVARGGHKLHPLEFITFPDSMGLDLQGIWYLGLHGNLNEHMKQNLQKIDTKLLLELLEDLLGGKALGLYSEACMNEQVATLEFFDEQIFKGYMYGITRLQNLQIKAKQEYRKQLEGIVKKRNDRKASDWDDIPKKGSRAFEFEDVASNIPMSEMTADDYRRFLAQPVDEPQQSADEPQQPVDEPQLPDDESHTPAQSGTLPLEMRALSQIVNNGLSSNNGRDHQSVEVDNSPTNITLVAEDSTAVQRRHTGTLVPDSEHSCPAQDMSHDAQFDQPASVADPLPNPCFPSSNLPSPSPDVATTPTKKRPERRRRKKKNNNCESAGDTVCTPPRTPSCRGRRKIPFYRDRTLRLKTSLREMRTRLEVLEMELKAISRKRNRKQSKKRVGPMSILVRGNIKRRSPRTTLAPWIAICHENQNLIDDQEIQDGVSDVPTDPEIHIPEAESSQVVPDAAVPTSIDVEAQQDNGLENVIDLFNHSFQFRPTHSSTPVPAPGTRQPVVPKPRPSAEPPHARSSVDPVPITDVPACTPESETVPVCSTADQVDKSPETPQASNGSNGPVQTSAGSPDWQTHSGMPKATYPLKLDYNPMSKHSILSALSKLHRAKEADGTLHSDPITFSTFAKVNATHQSVVCAIFLQIMELCEMSILELRNQEDCYGMQIILPENFDHDIEEPEFLFGR
ncbi:Hypothetical predicted protein [Cloeon dipterum]|uniref:Uncharacterized protein n=1 Tax=Cloeon dipterum TaxID=197152 RepID=A0A8S1E1G8_9INSE|nr:Hypothetical predicted protein [Cloeon dipterum]